MFKTVQATIAVVLLIFTSSNSLALSVRQQIGYYGDDFYRELGAGKRDQDLIVLLRTILASTHMRNKSGIDTIASSCDSNALSCYQHTSIGYNSARKVLMGTLHLSGSAGSYKLRDVYCEKEFTNTELGGSLGPGKIPENSTINTEHTWPQSRFNRALGKDVQKSDLHHLFPTDSEMNAVRGNHKFGDVAVPDKALKCSTVKLGTASGKSEAIFEPPVAHKGNVARALFYFSIRYKISIDPQEEAFLKTWNRMDPVDQAESDRNEAIYKLQGNRNPFIDHSELVDQIADF